MEFYPVWYILTLRSVTPATKERPNFIAVILESDAIQKAKQIIGESTH
jgi:hypothetical protein